MDEVADLIHTVLTAAEPGTTAAGAPSKARYVLEEKVAESVAGRAADLLAGHPLYPGIDLA